MTTIRPPASKLQTGALYQSNQTIEQMYRSCVPAILSFFLIAGFFFFLFPAKAFSVPVLKEGAKYRVQQRYKPTPPARSITTLGSYRDFSGVKKNVSFLADLSRRFSPRLISAKSIIVMDSISGKTLFSRSPDTPRQPASTIKVLTGMLAIDSLTNREKVSVSKKAARQPRSKIYLDQRKTYQANDLINAVLLSSANDASVALAEKIAGSEKKFARKMTGLAQRFGATNTVCKTASGLTAKGQKSTARDLAVIFRKAMRHKEFAGRMGRAKIKTAYGKMLRNHNKALWQIDGTLGGKTGYTNAARQTYVGKFKRGNDEIIVAIMGSETMWGDLKRLVNYGFA
ncbi:MAG: D-alanyl-D-alanine carboxypeptidase family protein, partial [Desulfobulbia bacterium]